MDPNKKAIVTYFICLGPNFWVKKYPFPNNKDQIYKTLYGWWSVNNMKGKFGSYRTIRTEWISLSTTDIGEIFPTENL